MSLIEQAAKRLEELKRSGAAGDEQAATTVDGAPDNYPTPEAIVRALEARRESPLDIAAAEAKAAPPPAPVSPPAVRRRVEPISAEQARNKPPHSNVGRTRQRMDARQVTGTDYSSVTTAPAENERSMFA